jgi:acetyl-CoA acetyltransferase
MSRDSIRPNRLGRPVVVLGGLRTPWAKAGTALAGVHAAELGIPAEELLLRLEVAPAEIDEVIFGNVAQPRTAPTSPA